MEIRKVRLGRLVARVPMLLAAACLLSSGLVPVKHGPSKQGAWRPPALSLHPPALALTSAAPLLTALPASAIDDVDDFPDVVNLGLTVIIAGFALFIGKFVLDLAVEAGSQTSERLDRLGVKGGQRPRQRQYGELYDDTDYSYKENQQAVQNSRTRKKRSKQETSDGKRYAPWMNIDEKRVEQVKAQRKALKKARGRPGGRR